MPITEPRHTQHPRRWAADRRPPRSWTGAQEGTRPGQREVNLPSFGGGGWIHHVETVGCGIASCLDLQVKLKSPRSICVFGVTSNVETN